MLIQRPVPRALACIFLLALLVVITSACDNGPSAAPASTATSPVGSTVTLAATATVPVAATSSADSTPSAVSGQTQTTIPQTTLTQIATAATAATAVGSNETPVAPEQNPVGDIPDSQAFVKYASQPGGYGLEAPEGWARTENGTNVGFVDKLDGESVTITNSASAPTAASARSHEVPALQQTGRAVQINSVKDVQISSGPAVLIDYSSNSEPNAVTGKQVRLENNTYLIWKNGKLATITLWAPLGADNVDQWQRIAQSFNWR